MKEQAASLKSLMVERASGIGTKRLPYPTRITEQKWPEGTQPLVSVLCITYNHEQFISQCLDGFLMQETTFPIEIIVHDDASTDGTAEIVRAYQRRYPQLFRLILQSENQYSKKRPIIGIALPAARGEYFAYCEGDDYWIYSRKLEKQVDILCSVPELVMVSHKYALADRVQIFTIGNFEEVPTEYGDKDVLRSVFDHPNTWLVRKQSLSPEFLNLLSSLPMGDDPWNLFFLQNGKKGRSLKVVWSVYRKHPGGIWSPLEDFQKRTQELLLFVSHRAFYAPRYNQEYRSIISDQRMKLARILGHDLLYVRMGQIIKNLRYMAKFRSQFFPAFSEMLWVAFLGMGVAAKTCFKKTLQLSRKSASISP